MKQEVSPVVAAILILVVIVVVGGFFYMRSVGKMHASPEENKQGEATGQKMMQFMQQHGQAPATGGPPPASTGTR